MAYRQATVIFSCMKVVGPEQEQLQTLAPPRVLR
jgi:hypothetical protein